MTKKGLSLFNKCAAECVNLCPQEEECTSSWGDSKMHTPGTIVNSQRTPTNKQKWCYSKVNSLVEQVIRNMLCSA